MNPKSSLIASVALAALCAACFPQGPPGGPMARFSPTDRDPVGFLVLNRDSIGLPDSTVQRLVQLNLRLYRRNQPLQNQIDAILHDVRFNRREPLVDSNAIPDSLRERITPLQTQIRTQTAAVKDTAWSWLTEPQKLKADSLDARQVARMRRGEGVRVGNN